MQRLLRCLTGAVLPEEIFPEPVILLHLMSRRICLLSYSRMQRMSQFFTVLQRQTPSIRQLSSRSISTRIPSATKSLRHPILTISVLLFRAQSSMLMLSTFQPITQWHRIQKQSTILHFRQVFRLSPEKKESVAVVVLQHFPSATMISDTKQERWLMTSLSTVQIFQL